MKGAREYASLFKTGQYGKLYVTSGYHARGKTFEIQILPDGVDAIPNGDNNCLNKDAVIVYGVVGGQRGWSESYGWLHDGPWVVDFEKLYTKELLRVKKENEQLDIDKEKRKEEHDAKIKCLLAAY